MIIASDAPWVHDEIGSVLAGTDTEVTHLTSGAEVLAAVRARTPDLIVLDMQIGHMGGVATTLELRLEEGAGRLPRIPILLLLDRRPDVFLARRSDADGWLLKPLDPSRLRTAASELLVGRTYHDEAFKPAPVVVTAE